MTTLREALKLTGGGIISLVGAGGKTSLMAALAAELSSRGDPVLSTTTTKIERPAAVQSSAVVVERDPQALIARCRAALWKQPTLTAAATCSEKGNKLVGFDAPAIADLWHSGLFRWVVVEADGAARRPLKAPAAHEPVIPAESGWVIGLVGLSAIGKPFSDRWVFRPEHFRRISGLRPGKAVSAAATVAVLVHPGGLMKGAPSTATRIFFLNQADTPQRVAHGRKIGALLVQSAPAFERVVIGRLQPAAQVVECFDLCE